MGCHASKTAAVDTNVGPTLLNRDARKLDIAQSCAPASTALEARNKARQRAGPPESLNKDSMRVLEAVLKYLVDSEIDHIVAYSKFVVAYALEQDGPNPGWQKANYADIEGPVYLVHRKIEGPVYLVRRKDSPMFHLVVKDHSGTHDLLDNLHAEWQLECRKNYIFYKVGDSSKRLHGLWFNDDNERQNLQAALEKTLQEIRRKPTAMEVQPQQTNAQPPSVQNIAGASGNGPEKSVAIQGEQAREYLLRMREFNKLSCRLRSYK